jgi:hypothetical protein
MAIVLDKSGHRPSNLPSGLDVHIPSGLTEVIRLTDGVTAPATELGVVKLFVDEADGDLKALFGDGTTKVVSADT